MSRRLPPLYALRAFEAASRHNSFTRAAEELSITQSAVSRHIRTLEEHFACRLFQRSGRNLQLTEAARLLLPGVREGFAALERACHTLNAEDDILRRTVTTEQQRPGPLYEGVHRQFLLPGPLGQLRRVSLR